MEFGSSESLVICSRSRRVGLLDRTRPSGPLGDDVGEGFDFDDTTVLAELVEDGSSPGVGDQMEYCLGRDGLRVDVHRKSHHVQTGHSLAGTWM